MLAYRRMWYVFLTGFVEPMLFLLSIGVGVGELVGDIHFGGESVVLRGVRGAGTARDVGDDRERSSTPRSTSS